VGARPLSLLDQRRMYLHNDLLWQVSDDPRSPIYQKTPQLNQKQSVPIIPQR
jgi:hypothetical protein